MEPRWGAGSDDCARGGDTSSRSIAAVLATVSHHSVSKVDTANAAQRGQKIGTSTGVVPAEYFELSSDYGRPTGGERPAALRDLRQQGRVQRHTVEHIIDVLPCVQILDVPVPQMGGQLVELMQRLDIVTPVQVIAVPKISLDRIPKRFVDRRRPQRAGQLVEVPTDPGLYGHSELTQGGRAQL